ncbi:FliO/MopB family protein [Curtobacterium ammoniigenes]|uniref:FliO/MopB family protein n=1 Tax=Curtobacterium ammoniigenes TaxID=395387 RepID=UPI000834F66B|nr:flagellar biosynthetic protein FliO [Curtobacterium ammoniigenes]
MDTLFTIVRVVISLAVVSGLLWFAQKKSRKWTKRQSGHAVTVVSRHSLGGKSRIVVVEADGTRFVLGVTDGAVSVLKSRDADAPEAVVASANDVAMADPTPSRASVAVPPAAAAAAAVAGVPRPSTPARGRRAAAQPTFSQTITSLDTWKKAAQSVRNTL